MIIIIIKKNKKKKQRFTSRKIQAPLEKKKKKKKKNPWIYPFDDYFALNILCMFNAIKLLYCIVLYCFGQVW